MAIVNRVTMCKGLGSPFRIAKVRGRRALRILDWWRVQADARRKRISTAILWWRITRAFRIRVGGILAAYPTILKVVGFTAAALLVAGYYAYVPTVLTDALVTAIEGSDLRTLLVAVGSTMVGATAIIFAVVIFALQANFENSPLGLFHKFSRDFWLSGSFLVSLLLALGMACLSLLVGRQPTGSVVAHSLLLLAANVYLVAYAYRRALHLVNPITQLRILRDETGQDLRRWGSKASAVVAYARLVNRVPKSQEGSTKYQFFAVNSTWTARAMRAVRYANSYARRSVRDQDQDVCDAAFYAIAEIHSEYVKARGHSFYSGIVGPFMENPLGRDPFMTTTLELLKNNVRFGRERGDEAFLIANQWCICRLCCLYLEVTYVEGLASPSHAAQCAGYLSGAVEQVVPTDMPDVVMEGVRALSTCAQQMIKRGHGPEAHSCVEKIGLFGQLATVRLKDGPVVLTAMEGLKDLTVISILSNNHAVRDVITPIRQQVSGIVSAQLASPSAQSIGPFSNYLSPYFSDLPALMHTIVTHALERDEHDEWARTVVRHIREWCDGIGQFAREMIDAAFENKSFFSIIVIQWVKATFDVLIEIARAPACDDASRREFERAAARLAAAYTWIPIDRNSVSRAESINTTEMLFGCVLRAEQQGFERLAENVRGYLSSWALRAGALETGWDILARGLFGLVALAARDETGAEGNLLVASVRRSLGAAGAPDLQTRGRVARRLRDRATNLRPRQFEIRAIDRALNGGDRGRTRDLLIAVAEVLEDEPPVAAPDQPAGAPDPVD